MFDDIILNEDIEFYIFVNNNGLIETSKVTLDIRKFKQIKELIYKLHNRSNIIRKTTNIDEIEEQYDSTTTKICILSQEYKDNDDEHEFYDFKYYTYDIDGEKIISILDAILENTDNIIMETYYIKQLIDWPFGNTPKELMEKYLIDCLLGAFYIKSIEKPDESSLISKCNQLINSYNTYKLGINQIINDNPDYSVDYLQNIISSFFKINFRFPKVIKTIIKPIAKKAYRRAVRTTYVPTLKRINTIYNKH